MDTEKNTAEKKNYVGIVLLIVVIAIGAYYLGSSRNDNTSGVVSPNANNFSARNVTTETQNPSTYDYTETPSHIGEYASVKGTVVKVANSKSGTIFFDYCSDYKSCPFSAVIFSSDSGKFSNPYQYQGQTITLTGQIKSYQGRAEIILNNPNQISQ